MRVCTGSDDAVVRVWDFKGGSTRHVFSGHRDRIWSVTTISPTRVASGSEDCTVKIWDLSRNECAATLTGHEQRVWSVAALGSHRLVSASEDSTLRIWDNHHGQLLSILESSGYVLSVTSLGGDQFASTSSDSTIRIWATAMKSSWECQKVLSSHTGEIQCIAAITAARLASACNNAVFIWDFITGDRLNRFEGHEDKVFSVAKADKVGNRIVSGSKDKTVRVWDIAHRECIAVLRGHTRPVFGVEGSLQPEFLGRVVSASGDGTIRLWGVKLTGREQLIYGEGYAE